MNSISAARGISWWAAGMPEAAMTPAARALSREGKGMIPLEIQPLIPAVPSALIVRPETASTTATISVPQDMLTFADAEPATVKKLHVQHLPINRQFKRRVRKVKLCVDK